MNFWKNEMSPILNKAFKDWQAEQLQNPEFVAAANELEPGYQIARLRIQRGLTQAEVARECNVHPSTVAYWERGHTPRGEAAVKYARLMLELESLARR